MSIELCYMNASDALERFRSRELSPVDVLEAQIARAEAVEERVNAFTYKHFDEARTQAKAAEQAYANGTARPLEGLTVAVKDEAWVAGHPFSHGSIMFKDQVPDVTDGYIQRLLDAGAIMHARSNVPELAMHYCTWNNVWPTSRNPWNLDKSVGGSSGGSGAALAAGITTLATGSDIGGSIRIPSAFNGVWGFKPPYGRVPTPPPENRDPYLSFGPMARCVADVALMERVMAGPDPSDHLCLPEYDLPTEPGSIEGMRIALSPDLGGYEVDAEIVDALRSAADVLRGQGATVEEVELGWTFEKLKEVCNIHIAFLAGAGMAEIVEQTGTDPATLTSYVRVFVDASSTMSVSDEFRSWAGADELLDEINRKVYLAGFDALITPTLATVDVDAEYEPAAGDTLTINGKVENDFFKPLMTFPFNILNRFPVLAAPIGRSSIGVPIGMQIVGPYLEDKVPFAIAAAYEQGIDWLFATPPLV